MKKKIAVCIVILAVAVSLSVCEDIYIGSVCEALLSATERGNFIESENIICKNETFLSLFLNNEDIRDLKISVGAVKSDSENGAEESIENDISVLREKIIDLRSKLRPTVKNIF